MVEYVAEAQQDGKTLIFVNPKVKDARREGFVQSISAIAEGIRSYYTSDKNFTREALRDRIKKMTAAFLDQQGFFGLADILGIPDSYLCVGQASPVNFSFPHFSLLDGDGYNVRSYLHVEPQSNGTLLAELETGQIPAGPLKDLFAIYHAFKGDFDYKESRSDVFKISPVTKGADAFQMLRQAGELYQRAKRNGLDLAIPQRVLGDSDDIIRRKNEIYRLGLLEILGVNLSRIEED